MTFVVICTEQRNKLANVIRKQKTDDWNAFRENVGEIMKQFDERKPKQKNYCSRFGVRNQEVKLRG